ncbi:MAG TPA: hypothetical protein GXX50_00160 [Firmicutes bacterium]|uniref:L7Ae/L30e/S12e/Gadd45 family ribosomal protein n=1 Tax=Gelria sp. Kuro-4 TaxID=2796927 RepID=UPI0019BA0E81|nr:ribosomal L7Ae/L30e/S12e/Gadd45 family protein [Gelria sp. Kuro-4]BCV24972.1 hypothetical protein kuro4_17450 [Gelria sp. Kuro-4]HHV56164.1 hypothetical protein [Bacillota bacterium]
MGLARKAGRLKVGAAACRQALARGEARLVVLACDGSDRTQRTFQELAARAGVPVLCPAGKKQLGHRLGCDEVAVTVITDPSLARAVRQTAPGAGASKTRG